VEDSPVTSTVRTVGLHTAALRFFLCKTLKRAYPVEEVPYPRAPRRLPIILTREEAIRMIDSASSLVHRAMLITMYSTGMRRSEASPVKVSDIDSKRMVIHIQQGKGSRDRDVLTTPKLLEALREYWRWKKPKIYLFFPVSPLGPFGTPARRRREQELRSASAADATPQFRHALAGGRNGPMKHSASDGPCGSEAHHLVSSPVESPFARRGKSAGPDHHW
jgi:integrase/recombinase XerD